MSPEKRIPEGKNLEGIKKFMACIFLPKLGVRKILELDFRKEFELPMKG